MRRAERARLQPAHAEHERNEQGDRVEVHRPLRTHGCDQRCAERRAEPQHDRQVHADCTCPQLARCRTHQWPCAERQQWHRQYELRDAQQLLDVGRNVAARGDVPRHREHHHLHHHQPGDQNAQQVNPARARLVTGIARAGAVSRTFDRAFQARRRRQRGIKSQVGTRSAEIDQGLRDPRFAPQSTLDQQRARGADHPLHGNLQPRQVGRCDVDARRACVDCAGKRGTVAVGCLRQVHLLRDERAAQAAERALLAADQAPEDFQPCQRIAAMCARGIGSCRQRSAVIEDLCFAKLRLNRHGTLQLEKRSTPLATCPLARKTETGRTALRGYAPPASTFLTLVKTRDCKDGVAFQAFRDQAPICRDQAYLSRPSLSV